MPIKTSPVIAISQRDLSKEVGETNDDNIEEKTREEIATERIRSEKKEKNLKKSNAIKNFANQFVGYFSKRENVKILLDT